jgi:hypothetical protein
VLLGAGEEGIEVDIKPLQARGLAHREPFLRCSMNKSRT